jgi:cytochrome P450
MPSETAGPRGAGTYLKYLGAVRTPHLLFQDFARRYGDFVKLPAGPKDVYLLSHPDQVREVLVDQQDAVSKGRGAAASGRMLGDGLLTTEAARHDADLEVVQPAFNPVRLTGLGDAIAQEAARCLDRLFPETGRVDVYPRLAKVTLPMVVMATLGEGSDGGEGPRIVRAIDDLYETFNALRVLPSLGPLVHVPIPRVRRFERASETVDDVLGRAIASRRADPGPWMVGDMFEVQGRRGLSDHEIRDQLVQIYGGHRPARVAQSWTMYQLARNPDVQQRLHDEVDLVLDGRIPAGDDYHRLPYTRQVFAESLRFYPPVWILTRRVLRDMPVSGGVLPADSILFVSEWVIHHDPRWYPDPERFDPERFTEEATRGRPEHAFFPFGAGRRGCVGSPFAWLEGVLLLASIAQRWRISLVPGFEPEPLMRVNIKPRRGMLLHLERRKKSVKG